MTTPICFVDAARGGITLYNKNADGKTDLVGWGSTPETIAGFMQKFGVEDTLMASSSMDFASEYGFASDNGAKSLLDDAFNIVFG